MYEEFLASIYDDLYVHGLGKDYEVEANEIRRIIAEHHPAALSLLDVGCGTGLHLGFAVHSIA